MSNPLEALMMPVDDDERMRALARSLRGRQVAADFFSGSTIPELQKMAQGEQQYIQDVAERQGGLREALQRRKQDQAQHDAYIGIQRDNLQQRKDEAKEYNALRLSLAARDGNGAAPRYSMTPKTYELADGTESTVFLSTNGPPIDSTTQRPVDLSGARMVTPMTEAQTSARLEKLGTRNAVLQPLVYGLMELDELLKPYAAAGVEVEDVPGMGWLEKGTGITGGLVRGVNDLFEEGSPQGDVFSAVQAVMNYIAVNRAGLAQTLPEVVRIEKELGKDWYSDPEVFPKGLQRLKSALQNSANNIRATTPNKVLNMYRANLQEGDLDLTNVSFPEINFGGEAKETSSGLTEAEQRRKEELLARKRARENVP